MNSVLLITGASRGIGAATAERAAARGYAVCVNYRSDRRAADAVVQKIRTGGGTAIAVGADVAVEEQVVALFRTVDEQLGPVNALVNNAGVLAKQARVDEMDAARIQQVLWVNVLGSITTGTFVDVAGGR